MQHFEFSKYEELALFNYVLVIDVLIGTWLLCLVVSLIIVKTRYVWGWVFHALLLSDDVERLKST